NGIFIILLPLILRLKIREDVGINIIVSSAVVILMSAGYFFVLILSYNDLQWQLDTALKRLILQVWPCIIFIFFLLFDIPVLRAKEKELKKA
ncbi:MAG: hypothetical protein ABIA63_07470, partial [bacterium]